MTPAAAAHWSAGAGGAELGRGSTNRSHDVVIARAPAQVSLEPIPDLFVGRVRVIHEQVDHGHDHPGGAVAALQRVAVPERLLDRVQFAVGQALHCGDLGSVRLHGQHRAALHAHAVEQDHAGAARCRRVWRRQWCSGRALVSIASSPPIAAVLLRPGWLAGRPAAGLAPA